jgi:hypothetical protein
MTQQAGPWFLAQADFASKLFVNLIAPNLSVGIAWVVERCLFLGNEKPSDIREGKT